MGACPHGLTKKGPLVCSEQRHGEDKQLIQQACPPDVLKCLQVFGQLEETACLRKPAGLLETGHRCTLPIDQPSDPGRSDGDAVERLL